MKLRTLPLAALAAVAVLVPANATAPAYATAPAPGDVPGVVLNAPTAGHITGTVTSDQPYVGVRLASNVPATFVPIVNGSGTFDLETWGYRDSGTGNAIVEARACDGAVGPVTCSNAQTSGVEFTPIDVVPQVSEFADNTIGPEDPNPGLTVSDPNGGGVLKANWSPPGGCSSDTEVNRNGTTQLNICGDGIGFIHLFRCASANTLNCTPIYGGLDPSLQVHRTLNLFTDPSKTITQARPNSSFVVYADSTGTYQLNWHLQKLVNDVPVDVPDTGGTANGTLAGVGQVLFAAPVTIPGAGLEDGQYVVAGTITVHTPSDPAYQDFGTYTDVPLPKDQVLTVDTTGPAVSSITTSPTKIYPRISSNATYKPSTKITVTFAAGDDVQALLIYRKSTGALVRTLTPSSYGTTHVSGTWNGRSGSNTGPVVPSGTYLIKARDGDKNISSTVGQVTVSGYRLVAKTWTHTFTPAATLVDKYVGKCSTLRKPSLRGWYNSFGYYANTRCTSQTTSNSLVSTVHAAYLPSAAEYTDIRVSAYGGAAQSKPGSRAVIRYLRTDGSWGSEHALSGTLGTHDGMDVSARYLVYKDHGFAWGLYTGFGYRYDVKSFTVVLHYKVLG